MLWDNKWPHYRNEKKKKKLKKKCELPLDRSLPQQKMTKKNRGHDRGLHSSPNRQARQLAIWDLFSWNIMLAASVPLFPGRSCTQACPLFWGGICTFPAHWTLLPSTPRQPSGSKRKTKHPVIKLCTHASPDARKRLTQGDCALPRMDATWKYA